MGFQLVFDTCKTNFFLYIWNKSNLCFVFIDKIYTGNGIFHFTWYARGESKDQLHIVESLVKWSSDQETIEDQPNLTVHIWPQLSKGTIICYVYMVLTVRATSLRMFQSHPSDFVSQRSVLMRYSAFILMEQFKNSLA